jgi:hypothetical protein
MSRSGYSDDITTWSLICWRGAVKSAINGKRGQAFLKEMLEALDNLPEKKLIYGELVTPGGEVCAIGSVMAKRGIDVKGIDINDPDQIAELVGISQALVREIEDINDDKYWGTGSPEKRFAGVRQWIVENLKEEVNV